MDVRIRGLSEDVVRLLKDQAKRLGKDWQSFLHDALTDAAMRPRLDWADRLDRLRESIRAVSGDLPDSTTSIREERDQWG